MTITTYDPSSIILAMGDSNLVGWNSISISRSPAISVIKGIRGKHTRTVSYDNSAIIRLSISSASEWNLIFSNTLTQDIRLGTGRWEVMLKDTGGTSLFKSSEAYIVNYADVTFDNTISERVWIIQCLTTDVYNVGSTTSPISSILDTISSGVSTLFG